MGQLEEARPLLEEALQAQRETLGDRHRSTLISIGNMGQLLQAMGKLEEAMPLYEEALQGKRETLGDRHPSTLTSISNMGDLLKNMGKLEEARPLLEEVVQVGKETLGDRHPHTLIFTQHLDQLLKDTWASELEGGLHKRPEPAAEDHGRVSLRQVVWGTESVQPPRQPLRFTPL